MDSIAAGAPLWLVGGTVLDFIARRQCHEIDAISMMSRKDLLGLGGIPVGGHSETHAWRLNDLVIEVSPCPENLKADLLSRDCSSNAIAMVWPNGEIFDPASGRRDRWNKTVSLTHPEQTPCAQDPLRILRYYRKVAYGENLTLPLFLEISRNVRLLPSLPPERFGKEMIKILIAPYPSRALNAMARVPNLFASFAPILKKLASEGRPDRHRWHLWKHTLNVIQNLPADPILRLAALLHDTGKTVDKFSAPNSNTYAQHSAKIADKLLTNWAIQKQQKKAVIDLVGSHHFLPSKLTGDIGYLRAWLARHRHHIDKLLQFQRADRWASGTVNSFDDIDRLSQVARRELDLGFPMSPSDLAIDSESLFQTLNVQGRDRAILLDQLWQWVLKAPQARNNPEILEEKASKLRL